MGEIQAELRFFEEKQGIVRIESYFFIISKSHSLSYTMNHHQDICLPVVSEMLTRLAERIAPADLVRIREAYEFAHLAHTGQTRKTGEPYIIHPVAVARIVAEEFLMDANSIVAAFLHDVVEDTPYGVEDIRERFGDDVAFLVKVVTKPKGKSECANDCNRQENNFRQLLDSVRHDLRAVLVKLADRLHNMRTLGSMQPVKQMKIGGETDFFYAPFANRLGLHGLRRELENLSFKFRCSDRYERLEKLLADDIAYNADRLEKFTEQMRALLAEHQLYVRTEVRYRMPYSIDKRMRKTGRDFSHVEHRYVIRVIYDRERLSPQDRQRRDKAICLRIYGVLTNHFKEKTGSILNYIDNPKENGYQSFHVQLLGNEGIWEEIHISSEQMVKRTKLGLILDKFDDANQPSVGTNRFLTKDDRQWLDKFCLMLQQVAENDGDVQYMEGVTAALYSEDITVYDKAGRAFMLPQQATAIDFAFEIGKGAHAQYARIDGRLASLKTPLEQGNCVEIKIHPEAAPKPDWVNHIKTYKAKKFLKAFLRRTHQQAPHRCEVCAPLPGQEVIGFVEDEKTTIHRRDCPMAISLSARRSDAMVDVEFMAQDHLLYPVRTQIRAIDRCHLLRDIVCCLTEDLHLSMEYLHTEMADNIVECTVHYSVHSAEELRVAVRRLATIDGVDEVYKL